MPVNTDFLNSAVGAFCFEGGPFTAQPYGEGHINDTFLVQSGVPGARRYILQRVNTTVFKAPVQLMENISAVTTFLANALREKGGNPDRETLTLIPTRDGENHYVDAVGGFWRAYLFVEDTVTLQKANTPALFAESGRAFAEFALLLDKFPATTLHETIPHFHNTRKRLVNLMRALMSDTSGRVRNCKPEAEFIVKRKSDCGELLALLDRGELPLRVTHNDTKLNNVLLDKTSMRGVCVIDLDTVMPGLIANDFGDSIRFGASTAAEDEQNLSLVEFDMDFYRAYLESYLDTVGGALTERERKALPWGARLMTLECGMRFLTDYLEGDVYFKVHRENHNLHRARTQFKLVAEMEHFWRDMQVS